MTPPALDHAVKKCLAKVPDERWQSASDLASELKWIGEGGAQAVGAAPRERPRKARERIAWLITCASVLALITVAIWWRYSKGADGIHAFLRFDAFPERARSLYRRMDTRLLSSPWGNLGVKSVGSRNGIGIYELGAQGGRSLEDTEGASYPFWSRRRTIPGVLCRRKTKEAGIIGRSSADYLRCTLGPWWHMEQGWRDHFHA